MNERNDIDGKLFQYLLWGQCPPGPCRFRVLGDFQAWAAGIGYDPEACREPWKALRSMYRQLYGEPVFEEKRMVEHEKI